MGSAISSYALNLLLAPIRAHRITPVAASLPSGDEVNNREEGAKKVQARRSTAFRTRSSSSSSKPHSWATSLRSLTLNRRLYQLARTRQYRSCKADCDTLSVIPPQSDLAHLVRQLELVCVAPSRLPVVRLHELLAPLKNLARLDICELETSTGRSDDLFELPTQFSQALSSLPQLRRLKIDFETIWCLSDAAWTVAAELPRLEELNLGEGCVCVAQLLDNARPFLRDLHLPYNAEAKRDHVYPNIPWQNLTHLSLSLGSDPDDPQRCEHFIRGLRDALFPSTDTTVTPVALPLRSLKLDDFVLGRPDLASDYHMPSSTFRELLHLLSHTSVQQLYLFPAASIEVPLPLPIMPSVTSLVLDSVVLDLSQANQLRTLFPFFYCTPSLQHLRLIGNMFSPGFPPDQLWHIPLGHPQFHIQHPTLTALVIALLPWPVLSITWLTEVETFYWTRSSVDGGFALERWRSCVPSGAAGPGDGP